MDFWDKGIVVQVRQDVQFLTINADEAGQRLDNYLFRQLKSLPKSHVYRLLRKGEVRVNKKRVKPDYRIQVDDIVRLPPLFIAPVAAKDKPSPRLLALLAESILYEDKRLMVVNKPAGLPSHGGTGVHCGLIEALRELAEPHVQLELVHRLDKGTSGCLLIAKKRSVLRELHEQIRQSQVKKQYLALVHGCWPVSVTQVSAPLKKNTLKSGERIVTVDAEGKSALTHTHVDTQYAQASLLKIRLETGRTHQIRVHTAHQGHPIVGDDKYGDVTLDKALQVPHKRLCLHAHSLGFMLPGSTEHMRIEAPIPEDFASILAHLDTA